MLKVKTLKVCAVTHTHTLTHQASTPAPHLGVSDVLHFDRLR